MTKANGMIDYIIYFLLSASLISNAIQAIYYFKLKASQKQRENSSELQLFIGDLMLGNGLVRVSRIDPNDIFLRSPRNG
jgi:hypothetical protein